MPEPSGYDSSFVAWAEYEERARRKLQQAADAAAAWVTAIEQAERGNVDAMQQVAGLLAARHNITIVTWSRMPEGARAFYDWSNDVAYCPAIVDVDTFAVVVHELGHGLCGRCPGREPHRRDPTVTNWHHCLQCETNAWSAAVQSVPFSREMFHTLQRSLGIYRGMTPGPPAAVSELDRVRSFLFYATHKQARFKQRERLDKQARVMREVEADKRKGHIR
jgi:hypothetical protein